MASSPGYRTARLADDQLTALRRRLVEAADRMSDAQLLEVTDALHEVLRQRRRSRFHQPPAGAAGVDVTI